MELKRFTLIFLQPRRSLVTLLPYIKADDVARPVRVVEPKHDLQELSSYGRPKARQLIRRSQEGDDINPGHRQCAAWCSCLSCEFSTSLPVIAMILDNLDNISGVSGVEN